MTTVPLNTSVSVTLDASGNGTAHAGPTTRGVKWNLANAGVTTTTAALIPICLLYVGGDVEAGNFVDGTYTGNQDSTDRVNSYPLTVGDQVFAAWSGGDPGAVATLSLNGTVDQP